MINLVCICIQNNVILFVKKIYTWKSMPGVIVITKEIINTYGINSSL
ncbi:MAG: hypothetical protein JETT_3950 [Candidatus Jettenia ecosi]|uniref:Uncharacterized protein n=1 Tax=Candidatus Jettenia ecosi TaxID=2494326 RepID=A0A533Q5H9_9BACT|nr:MAG: hypothetical protein JETT_3950 [Candidatus Jettenia ecosi]